MNGKNIRPTTMSDVNDDHDGQLATLVSMGFDSVKAEEALEANNGSMDDALGYLLSGNAGGEKAGNVVVADLDSKKKPYGVSVRPKHRQQEKDKEEPPLDRQSRGLLVHHVPWTNPNEENAYQQTHVTRRHGLEETEGGDDAKGPNAPKESKRKAPLAAAGALPAIASDASGDFASTIPVSPRSLRATRRSEPVHQPGAQAIRGTAASLVSSPPPPVRPSSDDRENDTYLVSAHVVSREEDRQEPSPLVLASPMPDDDDAHVSRRDMKRFYIFGCCAVLLVLVSIAVAVALVFLLGGDDTSVPAGITESSGPPVLSPTAETGGEPTAMPPTTALPTFPPILGPLPTFFPTGGPAPVPTRQPTLAPTPQPFEDPTPLPTPLPTSRPPVALPPTPLPTRPSTEPPTSPPSSPPTSPPTPLPTRPSTEPPTSPPTPLPTRPSTEPPTQPPSSPPTSPPTSPPSAPPTPFDVCETRLPVPQISLMGPCEIFLGRQIAGPAGCEISLDNWEEYPDNLLHESCVRVIDSGTSALIREQCYGFDESIYFTVEAYTVQSAYLLFEDSRCPLSEPYTSNDVDLVYVFEA